MEEIKTLLDVSPTAILPQIKRLTDSDLVIQKNGNYELTDMGDQVFKKVQSLVNVLTLLEQDNYWIEHDLSGIPKYLLDRIGDLKDCKLVEPDPSQIFEPSTELLNFFSSSRYLMVFSSFYRPEFLPLYTRLGRLESDVTLIFTESVLEKIMQNYQKKVRKLATMQNTELFVCNDGVKLAELMVSDHGMIISLFDNNGRFYYEYMSCSEPEAINWAKELIEFCKSRAWQIENEQYIDNFISTAESEALQESMLFSLN
ncbi:winged helix-turn-helix domain-containing protein [Methanosarcina sp.]|uniref:helix-turn-helix transcriptional regulator n=1 Tax=Methanosarcina sp. TaxID=2213 RepID=UPI0029898379|nr:winged helix-turn-helix domain-containing protein [Methanosarcina sp.]MDW5550079.1 winged helix-turn-helix domain-containing protein [Methanosarcina sp.]MDW5554033.1 winged helix-turn-helix domain-containing protein [Methanosarcina sp.]MDW5558462.1 winged helix-turn-helix domain-containing protein [Methanosarcina sp.]